jgi:hypothetical protein
MAQNEPDDIPIASACSAYRIIGPVAQGRRVKLINHCPYPVTWSVQCRFGETLCGGSANFALDVKEEREITLGSSFVLDGPYRSH